MKTKSGAIGIILRILILILYLGINYMLVQKHEPWRDEAHHWLISRDLSYSGIIEEMKYDGHPCLWNLILAPFAKAGLPYKTLNFISLFFMTAAAILLLFFSPFPFWLDALLLFSPAFTYYFSANARQYSLIPLILMGLAATYRERHRKPFRYGCLIALLVQTHVIMLGMAAILALLWLIETIHIESGQSKFLYCLKCLGLPIISASFLLFQLIQVPGTSTWYRSDQIPLSEAGYHLRAAFDRSTLCLFGSRSAVLCIFLLLLVICLLSFFLFHTHESGRITLVCFFSIIFQIFVFSFIYQESIQRLLTWPVIFTFAFWVILAMNPRLPEKLMFSAFLTLATVFLAITNYPLIIEDYRMPYSDSKRTAEFINQHIPIGALILTNYDTGTEAIIPYLKKHTIYNPITQKPFTYLIWNQEREQTIDSSKMVDWIAHDFPGITEYYLIYFPVNRITNLEPLLETGTLLDKSIIQPIVIDERYDIYRIPL